MNEKTGKTIELQEVSRKRIKKESKKMGKKPLEEKGNERGVETSTETEEVIKLPYLDYVILGSGSSGNAVRIGDIMIDCGLPYSKMKEELKKCKALFITHIHGDHVKKETLKKIKQHHRRLKIFGNWQVAEKYEVDYITNTKSIKMSDWILTPFEVPHDVICQGITLNFENGTDVIYVTDSAGTKTWRKGKYDYLFIESNHDENKLKQIQLKDYKYDVIGGAKRHSSTQESKAFYYMNRKNSSSEWIELHKSGRFY